MARLLICVFALCLLSPFTGCNQQAYDRPNPNLSSIEERSTTRTIRLVWNSPGTLRIERNPNAELIEKTIQEMDWENSELESGAYVRIVRDQSECTLRGVPGTTAGDDRFRVECEGNGPIRRTSHMAPLDSIDQAVDVMLLYFHGDDRWLDVVDWNTRPQDEFID